MEEEEDEEDEEDSSGLGFGDDDKKKKGKKGSNGSGSLAAVSCQAENCTSDMTNAKQYHRRHKVCEFHAKAPFVIIAGTQQRFCQQCSRCETLIFMPFVIFSLLNFHTKLLIPLQFMPIKSFPIMSGT